MNMVTVPYLGIDCGSTTVTIVVLDSDLSLQDAFYVYHRGKPYEVIKQYLENSPIEAFSLVCATSSTPAFVLADFRAENKICAIDAVKQRYPAVTNILLVGSEKFARIIFNEDGTYRKMKANSTCAAGTGSFLDQQALRLGIESASRLAELAAQSGPQTPRIASRCSVFAKTDLIHAQQEGWSLAEISEGLCAGLARNIADTLFPGETLQSPTVMIGGVALNQRVVAHLSRLAGTDILVDEYAPYYGAIGAVLRGVRAFHQAEDSIGTGRRSTVVIGETSDGSNVRALRDSSSILGRQEDRRRYVHMPLEKKGAPYPDFTFYKQCNYVSPILGERNPVEIDIYRPLAGGSTSTSSGRVSILLGIDIGSTSTKAAVLDTSKNMLAGLYTRTAGDPIRAAQGILDALQFIEKEERR
ncbi:MAG: BadF/BadG/BcrA/BcrD ATPase family protein [Termitinemataceae bacterium]